MALSAAGEWQRQAPEWISRHAPVAKVMDYMLTRWDGFTRFLGDGRLWLTNNVAKRGLRGIALGRKAWLFCGFDRGGQRAAILYGLITTAKLNGVDPQAWLADVVFRSPTCRRTVCPNCCPGTGSLPNRGAHRMRTPELLPGNWKPT